MAYTIVSQNNTTTTLADELGNVIHVPARVTLATSTEYTVTKVNNNTATLEDGDGHIIRDVPCVAVLYGGGSSDTHNKGYFATQAALEEAYPTAEPGDYAIVGATDTIWIWDEDTTAWVDTDTKGQVQSVNSKTGVVVLDANDVGAVPQYSIMPMAGASNVGTVQYIGATDSTYTHNYFYENVATAVYDSTVSFEAATLSSSTIACSGSDFAAFVAEWGSGDITTITHGTLTYDQSGGLLVFVGKDTEETTVCTFQLYTEDYQDAGFTITGTLQDGDVIAFTCTITEVTSYAWERIDVQPAQVNADWNANSGVAEILNKPTLATVATTGSYSDLSNTPTIPTVNDATITITQGGVQKGSFTLNQSSGDTIALDAGGSNLPSQTGHSGEFLTTDGTDASWGSPVVATFRTWGANE